MWDLPGPGLEPMSPALAGGFLTTAPPGKSWKSFLIPSSPVLPVIPDLINQQVLLFISPKYILNPSTSLHLHHCLSPGWRQKPPNRSPTSTLALPHPGWINIEGDKLGLINRPDLAPPPFPVSPGVTLPSSDLQPYQCPIRSFPTAKFFPKLEPPAQVIVPWLEPFFPVSSRS